MTSIHSHQSAQRRTRLVKICEALPEVVAEMAGESHMSFRIRKRIFAYYLFDHHADGMIAFTCKSSLSEQRRLVKDDPISFFVPAYLGSKGWIAIRLDLDEVDWDAVSELARRAYQDLAPRKLAALVEEEPDGPLLQRVGRPHCPQPCR
ncbi:MAG: MmcQ/YjbR family DNA-binding protein [Acidobacteriota bacterium]